MSDEELLLRARAVWREAIERDDAFAAEARVWRLARVTAPPRRRWYGLWVGAVAVAAAFALGRASRHEEPALVVSPDPVQAASTASRAAGVAVAPPVASNEPAAPSPPVATLPDPTAEWSAAQAALRARDRVGAELHLRTLVAMPGAPAKLRETASFSLAELELARGRAADAAARLDRLLTSRDPSLAADALYLRAQSARTPAEKADLYARYLGGKPPSPYREQAMVEEAEAKRAAGDVEGARGLAASVRRAGPVPDVVKPGLERLERALGGT